MAGIEGKSFDAPDETRTPPNTRVDVVNVGGATVARITLQPGRRWSEAIKPIVHTESCQVHHMGTLLSGRMHVVHDDGSEADVEPGGVYNIEPGHDAWVVGEEPAVAVEFDTKAAATFARE